MGLVKGVDEKIVKEVGEKLSGMMRMEEGVGMGGMG